MNSGVLGSLGPLRLKRLFYYFWGDAVGKYVGVCICKLEAGIGRLHSGCRVYLEVHGTYEPIIPLLITVLKTIFGHLKGL